MSFVFVENGTIDRKTRKTIRSHVMQGKNAGRKVFRASRIHGRERAKPFEAGSQKMPDDSTRRSKELVTFTSVVENPQKMLGHIFSGQQFPVTLTWENRQTISQFFAIVTNDTYTSRNDYSNPFEPRHSLWLKFFSWVWDETFFHCTLSMMEASSDFFLERPQPSASSLKHVSQAIQLANRRLSGKEALSNKTLYVVLALTLYEQLRNDHQKWKIHLLGLYQLVGMRGGLAYLSQCGDMVEKICRLDFAFALAAGGPTHFHLRDIPFITKDAICSKYEEGIADKCLLTGIFPLDSALLDVAADIMTLAERVNNARLRKLDTHVFTASLITINYRLIEIDSHQGCRFANVTAEGVYLGLMSFMLTLTFQFGSRRLIRQERLSIRIKAFLLSKSEVVSGQGCLLLWLLFINFCSVFDEDDGWWLYPLAAREAQRLNIVDWENLHARLSQYPWIHDLHNRSAQRMCDQAIRARIEDDNSFAN